MYLKDLMQGEKYAFYSLVKYLVSVDGDFSVEEQNMVNEFLVEMQINEQDIPNISPEDAIDMFSYSSFSTRKKVYIELIGVTLCDEFLHSDEKAFLDKIANDFLIDEDMKNKLFESVNELLEIYKKMGTLIETP